MTRTVYRMIPALALLLAVTACSSHQTAGEKLDDAVITSKVEAKLAADPEVSAFNVDVDTEDGVVRLSGIVKHEKAREEAADLARGTDGVRSVVNDIQVGDITVGERLSDASITVKVKAKLAADPEINPFNIDVDTDGKVVTLSGTVASRDAKLEAEQLARNVKGVEKVRNLLKVKG